MEDQNELQALRDQVAALASELAALRQWQEDVSQPAPAPVIELSDAVTRRGWMKAAAAAAVGGAAAATLAPSGPVAAADPNDLVMGATSTTAQRTKAQYTGNSSGMAFLFDTDSGFSGTTSAHPAALGGWSGNTQMPNGVYGYTNVDSSDASAVVGITGTATAVGVRAANGGTGGRAMLARAPGNGGIGVTTEGGFAGVSARSGQYGVDASGDTAALLLTASNPVAPPDRTAGQEGGAIDVQRLSGAGAASLWFCSAPGSPGVWQKLAGPATAGAFHPINPARVYDSRLPAPTPGRIAAGQNRVVSVADERNETDGAVITAGLVPAGATAVAYNVTINATDSAGFLSVNPGNVVSSGSSSINWSSSNLILANAGIVKLDASRQVKVFCGGSGSTHFLIDITGYYL